MYDAWNRLVRVSDATSGETLAEYQYDGRNFRTVKCTNTSGELSEVRHFYYSSQWQVLEERVCSTLSADPGSLAPAAQYVWGLRYIDDLILRDRDAAGSSASAGDSSSSGSGALGERLYALQDPNWNVVAVADVTGAIVERYSYSAYGEPAFLTAAYAAIPSSSYDMDVLYCGSRWNADLGSYLVRNRTLWPHLGRWERRDPVAGEANLYRYCGSNPATRVDASGLRPIPFKFDAFIPGRLGTWLPEPFPISVLGSILERTDAKPDSRVRRASTARGGSSPTISAISSLGPKGRRSTRSPWPVIRAIVGIGLECTGSTRPRRRMDLAGRHEDRSAVGQERDGFRRPLRKHNLNHGRRKLSIRWGALPNIDYSVQFRFHVNGNGNVRVRVAGTHDAFPDYEALLDNGPQPLYAYKTAGDGPGVINLNTTVPFRTDDVMVSAPTGF